MREPKSQIGQHLAGKYRLEALIGEGGFSAVYRGTHLAMDRSVAVKILKPDGVGGTDATWTQRFTREAHVISKLHHPNTVTVFDSGSEDGCLYLVMEYIEGKTLKEYVRAYGPLAPYRAAALGVALASSLEEAHHHGVLHRDLKPANIMLSQDFKGADVFKVLDFGIAKWISDAQSERNMELTQKNSFVGTPRYAAPEQIFGQRLSPATDVYGVGMILWYALLGRHAIAPSGWTECMQVHLRPDPITMSMAPGVPEGLRAIVNRAIARKPRERYPSTTVLLDALNAWMSSPEGRSASEHTRVVQTPDGGLPSLASDDGRTIQRLAPTSHARPRPQLPPSDSGHTVRRVASWPGEPVAPPPLPSTSHEHTVLEAELEEDSLVFVHHNNVIDPNLLGSDFDPDPSLDLARFDRFGSVDAATEAPSAPSTPSWRGPRRSEQPTPYVGPSEEPLELASISEVALKQAEPEPPRADATPSQVRVSKMREERQASQQMFGRVIAGLALLVAAGLVMTGVYRALSSNSTEVSEESVDALDGIIADAADTSTPTPMPKTRGTFSFEGIRRAISADKWRVMSMEKSIEMPSLTQQTVSYRKGSAILKVTFIETPIKEMMDDFKKKSKFPARLIEFEDKAIRLLPGNGSGREQIGALEEHLKSYRAMVLEREAQTP